MLYNLKDLKSSDIYKLMSQGVIPRPIAWIVTEQNGVVNIAPFSYFTPLSSNPPSVIVSIGHKTDGSPKDSLQNIRDTKKCTICLVPEENLEKMHFSSKELARDKSEVKEFDIETTKVYKNYPPIAENTPYALFCTLSQEVDLNGSQTVPVILTVDAIYVNDSVITDGEKIELSFKPVARVGKAYAFLGKDIEAPIIK